MNKRLHDFLLGNYKKPADPGRRMIYEIIFESHTAKGRLFDIILLLVIIMSVTVVMIDSIPYFHTHYHDELYILEWIFTILFTIEFAFRLWAVANRKGYLLSLYGMLDLLAILPTYLSLLVAGTEILLVVRALRLLRVFRIFKMTLYLSEGSLLIAALYRSYRKISVFMLFILTFVTVLGSLMYLIEGPAHNFHSIPESIYWAIVTLTTVGYGDISPATPLGKILASFVMLCGYAIIAVPTGIVTSELTRMKSEGPPRFCPSCGQEASRNTDKFCGNCGSRIDTGIIS